MKKILFVVVFAVMAGLVMGSVTVGVAMAQNAKCPVMGLKVDEKVYTEHQGKRINFCCKDCIEKFKADPAKYMTKVDAEAKSTTKPAK